MWCNFLKSRAIALAVAADAILGDPHGIPHPVRAFGWLATQAERGVRCVARGDASRERVGGFAIAVTIVGGTFLATHAVRDRLTRPDSTGRTILEGVLAWTTLAARDLLDESAHVRVALLAGDLPRARVRLSRIVGRDTTGLCESEISRAAIETLAESLCDGIVAPLLALTFAGTPVALAFKAASTLDSMLGHREAPFTHIGFASAKLDDVLCFIPARVAAAAVCLVAPGGESGRRAAFATLQADGARHASPNAGRPEAAMAGALRVRLGGSNRYDGVETAAPTLGADFRLPRAGDIVRAERVVLAATMLCVAACLALRAMLERA